MIFVDTGYFIALLTRGDQLHSRAANWSRALQDSFVTTHHVLWEAVNWFSPPTNRARIHNLIDALQADARWQVVHASNELFASGLALHRKHADKAWSLTDCISFVVMREHEIRRALTHDYHFEQAGFEALLRRDPP
jgi:predicted nucleic acid-binding protein